MSRSKPVHRARITLGDAQSGDWQLFFDDESLTIATNRDILPDSGIRTSGIVCQCHYDPTESMEENRGLFANMAIIARAKEMAELLLKVHECLTGGCEIKRAELMGKIESIFEDI